MAAVDLCDEILRLIDDVLAVDEADATDLQPMGDPRDNGERSAPAA